MRQTIFIIVIIGAVFGAGVFGYRFLTAGPDLNVSEEVVRSEKLSEYRKVKLLRLDLTMLSDPFLRSLSRPASREVAPAVISGRENPFLPSR